MHSPIAYLRYLYRSKNKHGVHSPFVYALLTKGLKMPIGREIKLPLEYRKSLSLDTSVIRVTDFGAGSRVFRSDRRSVSEIANNAGISKKWGNSLFRLVRYLQPLSILEIGTSLGISTAYMAAANPKAEIITLEGCPETAGIAIHKFKEFGLDGVQVVTGDFAVTLPKILRERSFDMVFMDGNHQKEATLNYFNLCLKTVHDKSAILLDDIHWSPGMEEAWEEICRHPRVSISIDMFQWGLLFFRKRQAKQHFVLRL